MNNKQDCAFYNEILYQFKNYKNYTLNCGNIIDFIDLIKMYRIVLIVKFLNQASRSKFLTKMFELYFKYISKNV